MKKLLAFVVFALFSSLSFAASTDFSSESIRMGDTTHTRALSSAGILTESTCVHSMQGTDSVDHCISQTSHLSKKRTAVVRATFATISADMELSSSQAPIQRQSDSSEVSKSKSHTDSVSNRASAVMLWTAPTLLPISRVESSAQVSGPVLQKVQSN